MGVVVVVVGWMCCLMGRYLMLLLRRRKVYLRLVEVVLLGLVGLDRVDRCLVGLVDVEGCCRTLKVRCGLLSLGLVRTDTLDHEPSDPTPKRS